MRAFDVILKGLDSFDPDERRASVEAIVKFGDREGVIEKLIGLLRDKDKGVRDAVAQSLLSIASDFEV
jgi:HEAT repeat protein